MIEEGFVRELISKVQTMRKEADFEVMDRIKVYVKDSDKQFYDYDPFATIDVDGVGKIQVAGTNKACIDAALAKIKAIVAVPEIGEVYEGTVRSVMPAGAFVEFLPGKEGLLHISEISWNRIEDMEHSGLKEGDLIPVKLLDIDKRSGKFKLSHKVLTERPPRPKKEE